MIKDDSSVRIIVGGDIVPTANSTMAFSSGNISELLDDSLIKLLTESDVRIFNLETPVTDKECPIRKSGPHLRAEPDTIKGLAALNPTFVTLANNHIMDQDIQGYYDTVDNLKKYGIKHLGTGNSIKEVEHSSVIEINGVKIGIYACAEHEFSIAADDRPGANPFSQAESYEHVKDLKQKSDVVIVLYHGGKEYYRYPSPNLQKYCRRFVDSGADLVLCQHSHCIGCAEEYNNGNIVYGQGNFLFDKYSNDFVDTGLLVEITINRQGKNVCYIPIFRSTPGTRSANEKQSKEILDEFYERSEKIKDSDFVKETYDQFAKDQYETLLMKFDIVSDGIFFKIINKMTGGRLRKHYFKKLLSRRSTYMQGVLQCEAWNELLLCCLKQFE